jgi:hypothetical protein
MRVLPLPAALVGYTKPVSPEAYARTPHRPAVRRPEALHWQSLSPARERAPTRPLTCCPHRQVPRSSFPGFIQRDAA